MGTADSEALAFKQRDAQEKFSAYQAELMQVWFSIYRITAELKLLQDAQKAELKLLQDAQKDMSSEPKETNPSQPDSSQARAEGEAAPAALGQRSETVTAGKGAQFGQSDPEIQRLQATIEALKERKDLIEQRLLEDLRHCQLRESSNSLAEGSLPSEDELEALLATLPVSIRSVMKKWEDEWKRVCEDLRSQNAELEERLPLAFRQAIFRRRYRRWESRDREQSPEVRRSTRSARRSP